MDSRRGFTRAVGGGEFEVGDSVGGAAGAGGETLVGAAASARRVWVNSLAPRRLRLALNLSRQTPHGLLGRVPHPRGDEPLFAVFLAASTRRSPHI
jgi:hypothetical protein